MDANYVTKVFDLPVCLITIYDNLDNSTMKTYVKSYIHIHFGSFHTILKLKHDCASLEGRVHLAALGCR